MMLKIYLLGTPKISHDEQPIEIPGYRPLALLAYLLLTGRPHNRTYLSDLLFDASDDPRASLRWTLSKLRKSIGKEYIIASGDNLAFNFDASFWLDVSELENGDLDLYRGELLEGGDLKDASQFSLWLLGERSRLETLYQASLEERLAQQQEKSDVEAIVTTARKLIQLDILREDWHRALMRAYADQGHFESALAQYEHCRETLQLELNEQPSRETRALAKTIKQEQEAFYKVVANQPRSPLKPAQQAQLSASWLRFHPLIFAAGALSILVLMLFVGARIFFEDTSQLTSSGAPESALSGTTVTVLGPVTEPGDIRNFDRSMEAFEEETGIDVVYISPSNQFEIYIEAAVADGRPPDIGDFPSPGQLAGFAERGEVVDLLTFMEEDYLRQQYNDSMLELMMVDEQVVGVLVSANIKSLVWYRKQPFDAEGYQVPDTWDEMLALSNQMVADGYTPWCIAIESAQASGWPATDWVEDILLRTAPPETYDAWIRGELNFDSPEIRRAFSIMEEIWFEDTYVYGGRDLILSENFGNSIVDLLAEPPACLLHRQASFTQQFIPDDYEFGTDYDFFLLPPIDPEYGAPVLGGGNLYGMFNDRPEVRALMRYLTTSQSVQYAVQDGGLISPHRDAPFEWYQSPANLRMAQYILDAETYRFDASDLMPREVGTDSFWKGMVRWVEGDDLDEILTDIDESWPTP